MRKNEGQSGFILSGQSEHEIALKAVPLEKLSWFRNRQGNDITTI